MPPSRALVALACLVALALAACAAEVPWPPGSGSCIEALRRGRYKRARWEYWIDGRKTTRAELERLVYATPELRERVRRYERVALAANVLAPSGAVTTAGGVWATAATHRPALLAVSAVGAVAMLTGVLLAVTAEDPFRRAVNAYNAAHTCRRPEPSSPPPEPWTPPPESMPTLPSRGWVP